LADMRFLYKLDQLNQFKQDEKKINALRSWVRPDKFNSKSSRESSAVAKPFTSDYPMATITAGDKGATLLRINSAKLYELMDHDGQLADSFRALMLKSLQRKVGHLLMVKAAATYPGERDDRELSELDTTFGLE